MTTTRTYVQWTADGSTTGRPALDSLVSIAGDYAEDYDMEAAEREYLEAINAQLPEGFALAANGELFGPADHTGPVDLPAAVEAVDTDAILARHDISEKD